MNTLPEEMIREILSYVPEYGHRVSQEFHEKSLHGFLSAYCDFYRYAAKCHSSRLEAAKMAYNSVHVCNDINIVAKKYLKENLGEFLYKCLYENMNHDDMLPIVMLKDLGIKNACRISNVPVIDYNGYEIYQVRWIRTKIIMLYSLILMHENGLMDKGKFTSELLECGDIELLMEIIFSIYGHEDHIYVAVIRYFPEHVDNAIERVINDNAVNSGYIYIDAYRPVDKKNIKKIRSCKKFTGNVERNTLRDIRDHLLGSFKGLYSREIIQDQYDHIFKIITKISSLADE